MNKINFQDGTKISSAKVTIDEVDYPVTSARYNGATPLSAYVMNKLQDNIEDAIDQKADSSDVYTKTEIDEIKTEVTNARQSTIKDKTFASIDARIEELEEDVDKIETGQVIDGYSESTTDAYSANYVNELNTYSTEEVRIGTWIDGKPLYRKVINFNDSHDSTFSINISNLNISQLVNLDGIMNTDPYGWVQLGMLWRQNYALPQLLGNTLYLNINGITVLSGYFILKYTKTTD